MAYLKYMSGQHQIEHLTLTYGIISESMDSTPILHKFFRKVFYFKIFILFLKSISFK